MEMESFPTRVLADVGQMRPRTNREGLAPHHHPPKRTDVSALGMTSASLLRISSSANWSYQRSRFHGCDCGAPTRVQQPCYPTTDPTLDGKFRWGLILVLQVELARRPA